MRKLTRIIVHCSDSDVQAHDNIDVIRDWHLERGFDDVGYHFFIPKVGYIQHGRPIDKIGAHTFRENEDSIGICLSGRYQFKEEQFKTLARLINSLYDVFGIMTIHGHYEYSDKTCPNFNIEDFVEEYLNGF